MQTLSVSKACGSVGVIPTSTAVFFPQTSLNTEFRQPQITLNQPCLTSKVCVCSKFVLKGPPAYQGVFEFIHIKGIQNMSVKPVFLGIRGYILLYLIIRGSR